MDNLTLFAGFTGIVALWSQLRSGADRLRGLVVHRTVLYGNVAQTVSDYLYANTRVWRWGDSFIRSQPAWVRPRQRVIEVAYEMAAVAPTVALWRGRPLMFCSPEHPNGNKGMPSNLEYVVLYSLRGTANTSDLIKEAIDWQSIKETSGQRYRLLRVSGGVPTMPSDQQPGAPVTPPAAVNASPLRPGTRFLHWESQDIGAPKQSEPFTSYTLCAETAEVRADFKKWRELKQWYTDRGIPWRRGHLLHGKPGTGKTALVRAMAQEADFPVFAFDLSTLGNNDFLHAWISMQEHAPCIALIEDIDGVFHGRTNVLAQKDMMRSGLTFDCLLNAIGGIDTADGIFVVITTNKPELLDEALGQPTCDGQSTRPGRIDRTFLIPCPDDTVRSAVVARIYGHCTADDVINTRGMSAAQVTEYAISKALGRMWSTDETPATSSP